jgi:putative mRNA 3-end processing factor
LTDAGLYCPAGRFHVDPWVPVERAIVTHAHADHARPGSVSYLAAGPSAPLLATRLGEGTPLQMIPYGEPLTLGGATVSLHPAGHILGSAQLRIDVGGEITVVTGDYKLAPDPSCEPFEPLRCHTLVTEATFALPIYRWQPAGVVMGEILAWWDAAATAGRVAVLFCYALGKAQRILAELARRTDRAVFAHGAIERMTELYRAAGVTLAPTNPVAETARGDCFAGQLVLAPLSAGGTRWMRRFRDHETGFASGFMQVRGTRRRRGFDRGFVLSDHADWPAIVETISASGAERVWATHGHRETLARWLSERGIQAEAITTAFADEGARADED